MEHLMEIIQDYLEYDNRDTAIMINGEWGAGKTYYIKNVIIPKLRKKYGSANPNEGSGEEDQQTNPESSRFTPYYISLNGLNNLDEISDKILLSIVADNNEGSWGFFKSALKFASEVNLGEKVKIFQDLANSTKSIVNHTVLLKKLKEAVLIIDDLERVSSTVQIQDVLGYLCCNYLEGKATKIIFVCNKSKIPMGSKYEEIKEKTISKEIEFKASLDEVIDTFFSLAHYKSQEEFQDFCSKYKSDILAVLNGAEITNLRTVQSILDVFNRVFKFIPTDRSFTDIEEIFRFIVAIQNEIALGKDAIKVSDAHKLMTMDSYDYIKLHENAQGSEHENETYFKYLRSKYFNNQFSYWSFFQSLYTYITAYFFDEEMLKKDLQDFLNPQSPAEDAFINLRYIFDKDTENEVISVLENIVPFIESNCFSFSRLLSIYHIVSKVDETGIGTEFIKEIKNLASIKCFEIAERINDMEILDEDISQSIQRISDHDFKDKLNDIIEKTLDRLKGEKKITKCETFFELLSLDTIEKEHTRKIVGYLSWFDNTIDNGMISRFSELSNYSMRILDYTIRNEILQISNPWESCKNVIDPLVLISDYMEEHLSQDKWKCKYQISLIDTLRSAVKHIEIGKPKTI